MLVVNSSVPVILTFQTAKMMFLVDPMFEALTEIKLCCDRNLVTPDGCNSVSVTKIVNRSTEFLVNLGPRPIFHWFSNMFILQGDRGVDPFFNFLMFCSQRLLSDIRCIHSQSVNSVRISLLHHEANGQAGQTRSWAASSHQRRRQNWIFHSAKVRLRGSPS